jgi:hypothetical protein
MSSLPSTPPDMPPHLSWYVPTYANAANSAAGDPLHCQQRHAWEPVFMLCSYALSIRDTGAAPAPAHKSYLFAPLDEQDRAINRALHEGRHYVFPQPLQTPSRSLFRGHLLADHPRCRPAGRCHAPSRYETWIHCDTVQGFPGLTCLPGNLLGALHRPMSNPARLARATLVMSMNAPCTRQCVLD